MSAEGDRLVAAVRAIGPQLTEASLRAERDRALPPDVVALLRDRGLFWLKTPAELGGTPLDPVAFCDVLEEVAYHDASAGWAVMVGNGTTGVLGGALPDAGVGDLFAPGGPLPVVAGQFLPRGTATAAEGGLRISGRWSFCSGITHADWVAGACLVDGAMCIFCVPKEQATVLDTWHVAGLQGTGSNDFELDDRFVPDAWTIRPGAGPPPRGGPLFEQPPYLFVGNELGPVAVGIARRAIDDMRDHSRGTPLAERAALQAALGRAAAQVRAASLANRDAAALGWERSQEGRADGDLIALLMGQWTYAVEACVEAVDTLFRLGGGRMLALDHPMQRHLRNLLAARQHRFVSDETYEVAGRVLLAG